MTIQVFQKWFGNYNNPNAIKTIRKHIKKEGIQNNPSRIKIFHLIYSIARCL